MPISPANPLHIAYDGYEAYTKQRVGSNVFAFEIMCALEKSTRTRPEVIVTVIIPGLPLEDFPKERAGWRYQTPPSTWLWSQWSLPRFLYAHRHEFSVVYTPSHYAPRLCPLPYISSVMDLGFLEFPRQFKLMDYLKLKYWTAYSVASAQKVLCISEFTQDQVARTYQIPDSKLFVAYPACGYKKIHQSSATRGTLLKKWQLYDTPFFLAVGTLQPRKNIIRLVEAYEQFVDTATKKVLSHTKKNNTARFQKMPQLVLAGRPGWLSEPILHKIATSPLNQHIKVLGFVTEEEKAALYTHTLATVCVGLHEGFGIPALESQLYGSVPIISNSSSLPEVAPEAGILVDPLNTKSIADGLWQASTLPAKRLSQKRARMKKNLAKFSWESSAQTLLEQLIEVST